MKILNGQGPFKISWEREIESSRNEEIVIWEWVSEREFQITPKNFGKVDFIILDLGSTNNLFA